MAQRRRRVFVVASARNGFDPCAVLFESESVRRDTPPSRETPAQVAALIANGVGTCGAYRMAAFGEYAEDGTASTMKARDYKDATDLVATAFETRQDPMSYGDIAGPCSAAVPANGVHQGATVRRLTPAVTL